MNEGAKGEIPAKARIIQELIYPADCLNSFFKSYINTRIFP